MINELNIEFSLIFNNLAIDFDLPLAVCAKYNS